jgi:hypothetical protein
MRAALNPGQKGSSKSLGRIPDNWTKARKLSSQRMLIHSMRQAADIELALRRQLLVGSWSAQASARSGRRLAAHTHCQRPPIHHFAIHPLQRRVQTEQCWQVAAQSQAVTYASTTSQDVATSKRARAL